MTMLEERVAQPAATFSVTGGLAAQYVADGQMIPWSGTLVVEGGDTGDKRSIEMGALTTRPLPMPFMVQLENPVGGDGHDGATLTGRIDTLERQDDGRWWGTGYIDPTSGDVGGVPVGTQLALALDKQMIRGVSVDLDQVSITELRTKDGPKQVITAGRIIGATATPFQAFVECEIALDVDRMALAASGSSDWSQWESEVEGHLAQVWTPVDAFETLVAFAGAIPIDPPLEWFAKRKFTELTPLTVLPNGQVFGHIAAKGTCHISFANKCEPVPRSNTNYAKFRCGNTLTAEGTMVKTGPIVMDTVHPDLRWKASDAQSFYADTGAAVCDVVPYDDEFGMAVVGAMRPDVAPARIRAFRGSDISPDWRNIDGHRRECCALLAVNNSGFKLPVALAASAGMYIEPGDTAIALDAGDDVYALVASGPMRAEPCCAACAGHDDELVADADMTLDSSDREIRVGAVRLRFAADTFADTETAVKRDSEVDDEKAMRRAAVRARFAATPVPRYFRVAGAEFRDFSGGARKKLADKGEAMPDGSFPIPTKASLADAIAAHGRAKNPAAAKAHIIKRAKALGATDMLPDKWKAGRSFAVATAEFAGTSDGARKAWESRQRTLVTQIQKLGGQHGSDPAKREALMAQLREHRKNAPAPAAHDAEKSKLVAQIQKLGGQHDSDPAKREKLIAKLAELSKDPKHKGPAALRSFRVADPKDEAASAAAFAGALEAWLDTLPGPRSFRVSAEFAGTSEGARRAWESRKKGSGSTPAPKPPAAPKPAAPKPAASGPVGSSNHVGDALLHAGVPYTQASKIANVVGGSYKEAAGVDIPDAAVADALMIAGYKFSEANAVIDQLKAARTKLDSKAHVQAVKSAAATPKPATTLDKAHVESLFAKPAPAAKQAAGAKYSPTTEPRDEHGKPVDLNADINQPVRPDTEGDWYANHMESGSFQTDNKGNYLHYKMLLPKGQIRKVTQGVRWSENTYSQQPDHARRVWRNRGAISDALAASPNVKKSGVGLVNGGRTRVVFNPNGTMDIFNFDNSSQPPHATGVPAVK